MTSQLCLSALFFLYFLDVGNGYYYHWYVNDRMKTKIKNLDRGLVYEAIRNVQRIDHLKDYYTISPVYEIGQMLYIIRSKFARLVRIYVLAHDHRERVKHYSEYVDSLIEAQRLAMDIYNLIEMLQEHILTEPENALRRPASLKKLLEKMPELPPQHLRQRPNQRYSRKSHEITEKKRDRMMGKRAKNVDSLFDTDVE